MTREELLRYRQWNVDMLAKAKDDTTAKYLNKYIDDIDYCLETEPPRPQPMCGWERSMRLHSYPCPRGNLICNSTYEEWLAIAQTRRPLRTTIPKIR